MAANSKIEWTDASWTPIRARNKATGGVGWHCTHATPGCALCYAERINMRLGTGLPFKPGHEKDIELFLDERMLAAPLRWRRPRMIFVCSMTDLFADFVPDDWIDRVFAVMALAPQHSFQVLTKRAERMRAYFTHDDSFGRWGFIEHQARKIANIPAGKTLANWGESNLPNVWLGVSAEDQRRADERIPHLLATPAAVRFVSLEPLLGPIDLTSMPRKTGLGLMRPLDGRFRTLDWVIVGGESGSAARPMHPDWARALRDQCAAVGVPFFFKQWGEWLDADQLLTRIEQGPAFIAIDGKRWQPARPLNYADAAILAGVVDRLCEHVSDGTTRLNMGKHAAGRLLDGVEHNGMPR